MKLETYKINCEVKETDYLNKKDQYFRCRTGLERY